MNKNIEFDKAEKRLLRLFAFFAVIILVSQVLQFMNTRNNDNEYRKILVSRMIIVETSQRMMVQTTEIHRALLNTLIVPEQEQIAAFNDVAALSFLTNKRDMETIEKNVFTTTQLEKKNSMKQCTQSYEDACRQFILLLESDKSKAIEYKNSVVRPAFENCQQVQTDLIDTLNKDLQAESDKIASASTKSSIIILILGISPFLLLVIYLVFQSSRIIIDEFS